MPVRWLVEPSVNPSLEVSEPSVDPRLWPQNLRWVCPCVGLRTSGDSSSVGLITPCDSSSAGLIIPCDSFSVGLITPCDSSSAGLITPCDFSFVGLITPCDFSFVGLITPDEGSRDGRRIRRFCRSQLGLLHFGHTRGRSPRNRAIHSCPHRQRYPSTARTTAPSSSGGDILSIQSPILLQNSEYVGSILVFSYDLQVLGSQI